MSDFQTILAKHRDESDDAYARRVVAWISGEDLRSKGDNREWTGSPTFHVDRSLTKPPTKRRESMHGTMQVMDQTGHMTITWNPSNRDEVSNAESIFDEYTDEKGYSAFRVTGDQQQGSRINEFDPTAAKIMLVPQLRGG